MISFFTQLTDRVLFVLIRQSKQICVACSFVPLNLIFVKLIFFYIYFPLLLCFNTSTGQNSFLNSYIFGFRIEDVFHRFILNLSDQERVRYLCT